jgi:hypothetical protein
MKYSLIVVGLLGTCLLGVYLRFGSISSCGILFRIAYEDVRDDLTDPRPIYKGHIASSIPVVHGSVLREL